MLARIVTSRSRALILCAALAASAVGCASTSVRHWEGRPRGPSPDERLSFARTVARGGVPGPTPQLDALVDAVAQQTPELGLADLLKKGEPRLRPGDQVEVLCPSLPDRTGVRTIGPDGSLEGPVGLVNASGLTCAELAQRLHEDLKATYTQAADHDVRVRLAAAAPRAVEVVGRVGAHVSQLSGASTMSTMVPLERELGVHELITLTQGLASDADDGRLTLVRRVGERQRCYHFTYRQLVDAHLAGNEAWLEAGDRLIVPRLRDAFAYGEVAQPGAYACRGNLTVAALLMMARGETPQGDRTGAIVISRDGERAARPDDVVGPGDVLFVPLVQRIYVVGPGVSKNGPIFLPPTGLTAVQAISEAGWFTPFADEDGVTILREEDGRRATIEVPVGDVLAGDLQETDFMLRPGDTVYVPEGIW